MTIQKATDQPPPLRRNLLGHDHPISAAVRGSVRVRIPRHGSDRVTSIRVSAKFHFKKLPARFCPTTGKEEVGGLRPRVGLSGGCLTFYRFRMILHVVLAAATTWTRWRQNASQDYDAYWQR